MQHNKPDPHRPPVGKDLADVLKGKIVIDTNNTFVHRDGEIAQWAGEVAASR